MTEHLALLSIDAWLTTQWLGRRWLAKGVTCLRLRSPGQIDIKVSVAAWSHEHTSTSTALPFLPSLFLLFAAFKSFESNRVSRSVVPRLFFVLQQSKLPRFATSSLLILSFVISDSLLQISNQLLYQTSTLSIDFQVVTSSISISISSQINFTLFLMGRGGYN